MINMLKPAIEILDELNRLERKWTSILIHGIGKVQNVTCDGFWWRFSMKLDNEICIKCSIVNKRNSDNYTFFEDGDLIEFFGRVHTYNQGFFPRYNVSEISLFDARLSGEERCFSDVFMWNIKISKNCYPENIFTVNEEGIKEEQIAYISELETQENTENKWVYGHLIKKGKEVILQLDKVME